MISSINPDKMDEFDWEREIRKDEARVHAYMEELPGFIDLPDEDELLLRRMRMNPELVAHGSDWPNSSYGQLFDGGFDDDDDDDDVVFDMSDDWRGKPGADIYLQIRRLAIQWAKVLAAGLPPELAAEGAKILAHYGKMIARMSDMLGFSDEQLIPLKIALCKRILAGINAILGELSWIEKRAPKLSSAVTSHTAHLQSVREKTLDMIDKLRGEPLPPDGEDGEDGEDDGEGDGED